MKLSMLYVTLPTLCAAVAVPRYSSDYPHDEQKAASHRIDGWQQEHNDYLDNVLRHRDNGCTLDKVSYRKEWGALTKRERSSYTSAVKRLMSLPSQSDPKLVPGARNRFDDFAAVHMQYAAIIHHSGLFLTWHRYYVWLYERALRDEAGYTGVQPYWDWTLSWQDYRQSTVFDGSPWSMGSNGEAIPHGPVRNLAPALAVDRILSPGTGGGCIYSGPFANLTIHLGPVALLPAGPDDGFGYNPRCLTRDISAEWSRNTKPTDVVNVTTFFADVASFDIQLEGLNGVHAGGHYGAGGMMPDQYASSVDPVFFLHHAMIDRVWALWQSLDHENRVHQTGRTITARNNPPSENATLDTMMPFGILGPDQRLGDLVSEIDGPFCYKYV